MANNKVIPIKVAYDSLGTLLPMFRNKSKITHGISIMITSDCNLKCDFCLERFFDDHQDEIDQYCDDAFYKSYNNITRENTVEIIDKACENTLEVIRRLDGSPYYNLSILGGELFQDKYKPEIYQAYDRLLTRCIDQIKKQNGKYQWSLMTNLITKHPERITELAKKHRCTINASFDFEGRFKTQKTLDLWLKNIEFVKQSGATYLINTCMSKANIKRILADDPLWVYLYDNHVIHLEQFQDVGDDEYSVSSELLTRLYIHLYEHYPMVSNVLSNQQFFATCISVFPNTISWQCCDHFAMMKRFFDAKQCLCCEYFDNCELQDCYLIYPDDHQCYIRNFKDYVKTHKHHDRDFKLMMEDHFAAQDAH